MHGSEAHKAGRENFQPCRYWVFDKATGAKLGDFGALESAKERAELLTEEYGGEHVIKVAVQVNGKWRTV